jgi:hypothetical protein
MYVSLTACLEIKKQREKIEAEIKQGSLLSRKSLKKGMFPFTLEFSNEMPDKDVGVTQHAMEVKAQQIIEAEGITGLEGTRGYVMRRNNIAVHVS